MAKVYCKKCGLRGWSKCTHCRNIFPDKNPDAIIDVAQEYFETFMTVEEDHDTPPADDGKHRYEISFWTYASTDHAAMLSTLERLQQLLAIPGLSLKVAACIHQWELEPGEKSSMGCGHVGPEVKRMPANPYEKKASKENAT